jgi:hypothetical protein
MKLITCSLWQTILATNHTLLSAYHELKHEHVVKIKAKPGSLNSLAITSLLPIRYLNVKSIMPYIAHFDTKV